MSEFINKANILQKSEILSTGEMETEDLKSKKKDKKRPDKPYNFRSHNCLVTVSNLGTVPEKPPLAQKSKPKDAPDDRK